MDRLFIRMAAEFGHKWNSQFPDGTAQAVAQNVWGERLAGLSVDEIAQGIKRLGTYAQSHGGWPPGVAEFRQLCRPHREPYERPEFQRNALPQKPASRETALKHLRGIRGAIDE